MSSQLQKCWADGYTVVHLKIVPACNSQFKKKKSYLCCLWVKQILRIEYFSQSSRQHTSQLPDLDYLSVLCLCCVLHVSHDAQLCNATGAFYPPEYHLTPASSHTDLHDDFRAPYWWFCSLYPTWLKASLQVALCAHLKLLLC